MALVRYGGGIVQLSGSISGSTFARNRSGNYARARTKPVNVQSVSQQSARNAMSSIVARWLSTLTQTQRNAWIMYAGSVAAKNRLGENINLSGFNQYVRSNSCRALWELDIVDDGPTVFALPDKDALFVITTDVPNQQISVAFDDTAPWCSIDGAAMVIYIGTPQSKSRMFFGGPYQSLGSIEGDSGSPPTSPVVFDCPHSFSGNHKFWAQARITLDDARLSGLFRTNTEAVMEYCLSGTIVPDATGTYDITGYYNDKTYLKLSGGSYYCWWNGTDKWIISAVLGTVGAGYWSRTSATMTGTYTHQGTATGDPDLAEGTCP